jgi:hypothetical protein
MVENTLFEAVAVGFAFRFFLSTFGDHYESTIPMRKSKGEFSLVVKFLGLVFDVQFGEAMEILVHISSFINEVTFLLPLKNHLPKPPEIGIEAGTSLKAVIKI